VQAQLGLLAVGQGGRGSTLREGFNNWDGGDPSGRARLGKKSASSGAELRKGTWVVGKGNAATGHLKGEKKQHVFLRIS